MPKSYSIWNHRKWVIIKSLEFKQIEYKKSLIYEDFKLCELMLTKDERNFHVWNYRMWLVSQVASPNIH